MTIYCSGKATKAEGDAAESARQQHGFPDAVKKKPRVPASAARRPYLLVFCSVAARRGAVAPYRNGGIEGRYLPRCARRPAITDDAGRLPPPRAAPLYRPPRRQCRRYSIQRAPSMYGSAVGREITRILLMVVGFHFSGYTWAGTGRRLFCYNDYLADILPTTTIDDDVT